MVMGKISLILQQVNSIIVALGWVFPCFTNAHPIKQIHRAFLALLAQVGIPHGRGNRRMAQKFPHHLQASPPHDEVAGENMPQVMEPAILYPGPPFSSGESTFYSVEPSALGITEHIRISVDWPGALP